MQNLMWGLACSLAKHDLVKVYADFHENYYDIDNYPKGYEGELYPPGFTGGFFGRKWSLYEGGIRMPFIMRWDSKIPKSLKDSTSIVTAMDLFPSICSLIGIEYPKNLDGIDKSKSFLGSPIVNKSPVMWEYSSNPGGSIKPGGSWNIDGSLKPKNRSFHSPNLAIRDGDWKLLINTDLTGEMLYNLKTDPGENTRYCKKRDINAVPDTLDEKIWTDIKNKIVKDKIIECEYDVENTHRAVGTRLSHYVYKKFGNNALAENLSLIHI